MLLRRYGLCLLRYAQLCRRAAARVSRLYELQHRGVAFSTPDELLAQLGLEDPTQTSAKQLMQVNKLVALMRGVKTNRHKLFCKCALHCKLLSSNDNLLLPVQDDLPSWPGCSSAEAARFAAEVAGAANRASFNQRNQQIHGLAGLVAFLPAADPRVGWGHH